MSTPKRVNSVSSPTEEGPSPKRQRRSYSPASPPATEAKQSAVVHPPQTPPPSVHMSPEWQAQQLPAPGPGPSNPTGSMTFPTPPSTAGLQSQLMARGISSEGDSQTPRSEITNSVGNRMEGDRPAQEAAQGSEEDLSMDKETDAENRRSDHERHNFLNTGSAAPVVPALPGANVLYKLHTAPIVPSAPHPSQDLILLYSLERLQSSVARRDPVTGAKINKLRKSYEGKVKDLGLDGRNKATKSEAILEGLADPGWDMKSVDGTTLWQGSDLCDPPLLVDDSGTAAISRIEGMLQRALDLRPGHLPPNEHNAWRSLLGLDDASLTAPANAKGAIATAAISSTAPKTAASNLIAKTAPATAQRNSAPSSPRTSTGSRPERVGKKRRYDESSYAGYQEGYEDDGYSTGGIDDTTGRRGSGGAKRQKRKVSSLGLYPSQVA